MREYLVGEAPLFIKIDDYKDILKILDLIKEKVDEGKKVLSEIIELKDEEDSELKMWSATLEEIDRKVERVDNMIFRQKTG